MWSELIDGDRLSREKIDAVAAGTDRYWPRHPRPADFSASIRLSTRGFVFGLLCPVLPHTSPPRKQSNFTLIRFGVDQRATTAHRSGAASACGALDRRAKEFVFLAPLIQRPVNRAGVLGGSGIFPQEVVHSSEPSYPKFEHA